MFLVCGEALFDLFVSETNLPGKLQIEAMAAGSPFNTAIGIVRQGGQSALLAGISTDMMGRRLVQVLEHEGVETGYLIHKDRPTTLSLVDVTIDGQPAYAFYGSGAADRSITKDDLPAIALEIEGLHFGSYAIAVEPVATALAHLASREAHRFLSLDPNIRPTVISDAEIWREKINALLPFLNLVKVSTEDLGLIYPDMPIEQLAENWLNKGAQLVIITDGAESVRAFRRDLTLSITPPSISVVDTVGTVDAFQATILAQLAQHGLSPNLLTDLCERSLHHILNVAANVAATTCTRRGPDIPRIGETKTGINTL